MNEERTEVGAHKGRPYPQRGRVRRYRELAVRSKAGVSQHGSLLSRFATEGAITRSIARSNRAFHVDDVVCPIAPFQVEARVEFLVGLAQPEMRCKLHEIGKTDDPVAVKVRIGDGRWEVIRDIPQQHRSIRGAGGQDVTVIRARHRSDLVFVPFQSLDQFSGLHIP